MEKFIKTQGRDPFVKFESDSALAMFGHLNALVDAITILQETGGGGGGGNPVSIWKNSTEFSSAVSKLVFTGNGVNLQPGSSLSEVIVNVPGFNINNISVNSIDLNKLKDISSQTLLGRYSSGTGSVQTITLDPSLSLNSSTGVLSVTNPPITVQGTTNRISVTPNVNDRTFDLVPTGIGTGTIGNKNTVPKLTYDTYGRITTVSSESIDTIALTTGTISGAPSNANDIANKSYVDNFAQGLKPKASVRLATTANITSLSGNTAIIDGVRVSVGDRILVKDQTNPANNGVYVVALGVWTRATDYDSPAEAVDGSFVFVRQGTLNGSSGFVQISVVTTIGVSPITFAQFSAAGTYTAGTGLNLTGSQFSLTTISPALNTGTTYGNSSQVGQFTVDAQGRLSSATNVNITLDASTNQITGLLPVTKGGTGLISYTAGDILYATGNTTLAKLAGGTANNGKVLTIVSGLPSWQTAPTGFTNPLTATGDILYRSASSAADRLQIGSQGQFLRVSSSLLPVWETVNLLTNPMNSLGDMIIGGASGVPTVLDGSTATAGHVLTYTNSGPVWQAATGGVTSVSAGTTGLLPNSPSTGAVVLSGKLNAANGGTGQETYAKGEILVGNASGTLNKLAPSTNAGDVLKINSATATGLEWGTGGGGMDNPMEVVGDIIYGGTVVGGEATPVRLARNAAATDRFLRSNSSVNSGIPSWEAVPIQKTVVSFVIDGYGGPLTGSSTVFIANIPFGASYDSFTIQGDSAPSGTNGTNTVTLAVNGMSTSITGSTISSNDTTPVINIPSTGGSLTFSLTVTGPSVATTKLFVNLTGTRS
jgi:hypothetical protein